MSLSTDPEPLGRREYRIDELARAAGTTVRNVRAYQDRGLLHPPRRTGRVGIYSDAHLARLRLIGSLLERGYTLANIAELLMAWERGQDVAAVLGLEAALGTPGTAREGSVVDGAELAAAFGIAHGGAIDEAVAIGVLEAAGSGRYRVADPAVLDVGRLLVGAGVPLVAVLGAARALRAHAEDLARLFVELVDAHVVEPLGDSMAPDEVRGLGHLVAALRPLASEVVVTELELAMEEEIRRRLGDYLARRMDRAGLAPVERGPAPPAEPTGAADRSSRPE